MGDLTDLAEVRLQPVPETVAEAEDLLRRCKSGEVRGFAAATVADGGCIGTLYVIGDGNDMLLVYGLERLKLRLMGVYMRDPE